MYAIEIEHVRKSHGTTEVLRDLSLHIAEGEAYGLLGPQGAGKSTLIHLLLGFLRPASGHVRVLGSDNLAAARLRVGYAPERASYHKRFSARSYLSFLGQFSDLRGVVLRRSVEEQLKRVGLSKAADHAIGTFSKGMLQRLGIAQALLTEPDVLLLDEPLSGLDTTDQREVSSVLAEVRAQRYTILVCSSYTPALTNLCDRIGVLWNGILVAETHVRNLRTASSSIKIQVDQLTPALRAQINSLSEGISSNEFSVLIRSNTQQTQSRVLRTLMDHGVTILSLDALRHPLEQFYLRAIQPEVPARLGATGGDTPDQPRIPAEKPESASHPDPLLDSLLLGGQPDERGTPQKKPADYD